MAKAPGQGMASQMWKPAWGEAQEEEPEVEEPIEVRIGSRIGLISGGWLVGGFKMFQTWMLFSISYMG